MALTGRGDSPLRSAFFLPTRRRRSPSDMFYKSFDVAGTDVGKVIWNDFFFESAGGATNVTVNATVVTATLSIPTYTPTAIRNVSVASTVLSATFSIPAYTVSLATNISVSPAVLSATFSLPSSTTTAIRNVTQSPAVLACTFSVPAPVVSASMNVSTSPSVLVVTFATQTPVIQVGCSVAISIISATFSIPTYSVDTGSTVVVRRTRMFTGMGV